MIYILTSTQTILKTDVRAQESKEGDSVASGLLHLKLKQQLTAESFNEQERYLEAAAIAAYVSLNGLDQRYRYRASINLMPMQNEMFNFTQGSSSSGLGYALAIFDAWWRVVLQKPGCFEHPIFATGEVLTSGKVNSISQLSDKIRSTCEFINANKQEISQFYLCYPSQNTDDISDDQRNEVTELGGILVPVDRLQSLLGTLLGDDYDGDPLGRWEPFKGLNSFNYEDSVRFFGRDKDVERLHDDLKQNNGLLIVSGASGTGKSSLIKAGLIPRLKQVNKDLHWAYTTPNRSINSNGVLNFIFDQLNIVWGIEQQGIVIDELISVFNESISGGIQLLKSCITPQSRHCLLYLDQYEEIFSQANQADDWFTHELKIIDELASQIKSLDIVLALRSEYLGRMLDNQALSSPIISNVTSQLPSKAWHAIVNEQAGFSGINFAQGLDDEIISEAILTPYALPMVEFLLEQLYLKMVANDSHSNTLQLSHYKQMGGLSGAIAHRATQVINDSQADTQIVNQLFDTFIGLNSESLPYGRLVDVSQIATEKPELYKLIQDFTNANLIVSVSQGANDSLVKLAHDSLFCHWT